MSSRKQARQQCSHRRADGKRERRTRRKRPTPRRTTHAFDLIQLQNWFLPAEGIFAGLTRHGNSTVLFRPLVWLALLWAWAEQRNLTDAFDVASSQCRQLRLPVLSTYQGLMNALLRWTDPLMNILQRILQERMRQIGGTHYSRSGRWVPIAFDGSRSTAPRTISNEEAFCAANIGQGKTARYRKKKTKGMRRRKNEKNKPQPPVPQVWVTLLWHMGLRLPWTWRLGPSNSSERAHVEEMIETHQFPENTLFCGDAGFVGRPLWEQITSKGHHFLVRVGANVCLLSELSITDLKEGGRVLCWPQESQRQGLPPLELRLVKIQVSNTPMWMLTSVLDDAHLRADEMALLYQQRWGIEVEFRGLKQTLEGGRLRCRTRERVLVELNWSILAMAVIELFALKEQLQPAERLTPKKAAPADPNRTDPNRTDPQRRSLAGAMQALRGCLRQLREIPDPGADLCTKLRQAVTDDYERRSSKRCRLKRINPDKKPLGDPRIKPWTADHQQQCEQLARQKIAA